VRYDVSIERSAELLRQALPWMARQSAGLHPVSYAVWFDYVAQTNPQLRVAIDEYLARDGRLDEVTTHALFKRHVADIDPESAQRVVDGLQLVLGSVSDATGSAGAHVRRFGTSLAQLAAALERGDTVRGIGEDSLVGRTGAPPRLLADLVAEAIADTGTMRTQLGNLQQRLAESRREIERLHEDVRRAREDGLRDALTGLANRRGFDQALAACLLAKAGPDPLAPEAAQARLAGTVSSAAQAIAAIATARGLANAPDEAAIVAASGVCVAGAAHPAPAVAAAADPLAAHGPWLVLSDIDHYERISEAYGRGFGEEVLKAVGGALRSRLPQGATLARVDGEAFALLLPQADAVGALAFAEQLRRLVGAMRIRRPGRETGEHVTLSLGLAPYRPGDTPGAMVERAGRALQDAKRSGRDRVAMAS